MTVEEKKILSAFIMGAINDDNEREKTLEYIAKFEEPEPSESNTSKVSLLTEATQTIKVKGKQEYLIYIGKRIQALRIVAGMT